MFPGERFQVAYQFTDRTFLSSGTNYRRWEAIQVLIHLHSGSIHLENSCQSLELLTSNILCVQDKIDLFNAQNTEYRFWSCAMLMQ